MNNLWRRIGKRKSSSKSSSDKNATQDKLVLFGKTQKKFDLEDLLRASAEVLGGGMAGKTYKAGLKSELNTVVVVKRLKDVVLSAEDFWYAVEALGAMDHENLLPLRGYYYSKDEKLLLYDYMPLGSLSDQLHRYRESGRTSLSWEARLSIALGAARAIEHLHAHDIPHGKIKSSNVLIFLYYKARVSDYGLVPLTRSALRGGTHPTMAEDVYSFGVLLLELLTGKLPRQLRLSEEGVDLPAWVQSVAREEWTAQVLDVELPTIHDDVVQGMIELLDVAIRCVSSNPNGRPWMSDVRKKIEELCSHGGQQDGDSQLNQFSQVNNDMYPRKPPDGVLEVSERVYGYRILPTLFCFSVLVSLSWYLWPLLFVFCDLPSPGTKSLLINFVYQLLLVLATIHSSSVAAESLHRHYLTNL
ncbi:probable inactive receptor kinase At1g48480 [Rhodamnia argentea]|uniref:Probable inactive receptor kinase At1g48480 n=1 Tax=Rhodamnia argentea TaxID=178133 RepID=A0ABM3HBX3_9MYRT|nr:probable inactive receptor kinase At1g48480 [Rhodamnia argentea]